MRPIAKRITMFFCLLALVFTTMGGELFSAFAVKASAATSVPANWIENTDIDTDLKNIGIDKSLYVPSSLIPLQLIYVSEICFTRIESVYDDVYNLYFWVYNPSCRILNSENCFINLTVNDSPGNRKLDVVTHTSDHLFYKFKLSDSAEILDLVRGYAADNSGERKYIIADMTINSGSAMDGTTLIPSSEVATSFIYSGYGKGLDISSTNKSTLTVKKVGEDVINLKLYHTTWRNNVFGDSAHYYYDHNNNEVESDSYYIVGKEIYEDFTCEAIHTAYFGVPEKYFEEYGDLQEIYATWYEYLTAPIFVTSDSGAYNELLPYVGSSFVNYPSYSSDKLTRRILYEIGEIQYWNSINNVTTGISYRKAFNGKKVNADGDAGDMFPGSFLGFGIHDFSRAWQAIPQISYLFLSKTDDGKPPENKDDWKVSSAELTKWMENYSSSRRKDIRGKYSADLFIGDALNYFNDKISADQLLDFEVGKEGWWNKLLGITEDQSISPIKRLTEPEKNLILSYDPNNVSHVSEFEKTFYVENDNTNADSGNVISQLQDLINDGLTPVLFRFATSEYYVAEAIFDNTDAYYTGEGSKKIGEVDGYVAQESVFLDFDVIAMGFKTADGGNKMSIIPVVAAPIDVISGLIAPEDIPVEQQEWWQKLISLVLLVALLAFIWPLITPLVFPVMMFLWSCIKTVFDLVFKLVIAPFRLLWRMIFRD